MIENKINMPDMIKIKNDLQHLLQSPTSRLCQIILLGSPRILLIFIDFPSNTKSSSVFAQHLIQQQRCFLYY